MVGFSYDIKTFISKLDTSDGWCLTQGQQQFKTTGEEQTAITLRHGKYHIFQKHDFNNNDRHCNLSDRVTPGVSTKLV